MLMEHMCTLKTYGGQEEHDKPHFVKLNKGIECEI
jgi:hypothetical protein